MPSERWHADLPFRGSRTYVHSTSICNHLRDRFEDAHRFELVMRDWMAGRVLFTPVEEVEKPKATLAIELADGSAYRYALTDDPAHPVTAREPFDEDGLVGSAPIVDGVMTIAPDPDHTAIDRLVSGNKALINRTLDPGVRLIASKIALDGFPADGDEIQLRLESHLGTRIFRTAVSAGGKQIGQVVFYGQ